MNKKERHIELLKSKILTQHNGITTAHYEMTAYHKNVIYMTFAQITKNDPGDKFYYISIKDIETLTGREINYMDLINSTEDLIKNPCTILRPNGNVIQLRSLISSAEYLKGIGKIAVRISEEARPYLFDLKENFTQFGLQPAMALSSKYSKRLYEMLSQFKITGIMRLTVDELKYRLAIKDPKSGKDKYLSWTMFYNNVIKVASKEINGHTDISFKCEATKEGRKFTNLVFKIIYNRPIKKYQKDEKTYHIYNQLISKYRLSESQASVIVEHVPIKEISSILYHIQLNSDKINNIGAFTVKAFDNKFQLGLIKRTDKIEHFEPNSQNLFS